MKQAFLCTPWPTGKVATRTVADAGGPRGGASQLLTTDGGRVPGAAVGV